MELVISIVVLCRNEVRYIENCLKSIMNFQIPHGVKTEILIMDGMSSDGTRKIVTQLLTSAVEIRLCDNIGLTQSAGFNAALRIANGDYIMRLDTHSIYPSNYLSKCIETATETNADNVGGRVITLKGGDGFSAGLVQAITTHKFGVGNSSFRTENIQGKADTVPFGFFKKEIFDKIGFLDERLIRAQDYEFNRRIAASGGKIWLNSQIQTEYYNQPTLTKFYSKQFFKEAPYNVYLWYLAPYAFAVRHAVTGFFTLGILAGLVISFFSKFIAFFFVAVMLLYLLIAVLSGIQQAIRYKQPMYIGVLPFCFFLFHFTHGLGILYGCIRILSYTAPVQGIPEPWPGAGRFRAFHKVGHE